jgi:putative MATE family efflux protein
MSVVIAQYFGAKDYAKVKAAVGTAYVFVVFASLAFTIIGILIVRPVLGLMNTPADIFSLAENYLRIIFLGISATFGYNMTGALLRGLGDSKTPLYALILATVLNIFLDLLFVLAFDWGVAGVAWATILSQLVSFVIVFVYLQKKHEMLKFDLRAPGFDIVIFRQSIRIGLPNGIQQMFVAMSGMALNRIVNGFGTNAVAGFSAAMRIDSFAMMPAMNIGMALNSFTGQNIGASKPERVKRGYLAGMLIAGAISLTMSLCVVFLGRPLMGIFTKDSEVIAIGSRYLLIVGSFYLVFGTMFVTNGVVRGAGAAFFPTFSTLTALWAVRIPLAFLFSSRIGLDGIWWSIPCGWLVGMSLALGYYFSGRWKRRALVKATRRQD